MLRPHTALIEREAPGGVSNAGDPLPATPTTVIAALPCFISEASMNLQASIAAGALGPSTQADYVLVCDGIAAGGNAPGTQIVSGGITYIVAADGRGAFPDVKANDRVTRADGAQFLVVGPPSQFSDVAMTQQVRLAFGKAWG